VWTPAPVLLDHAFELHPYRVTIAQIDEDAGL